MAMAKHTANKSKSKIPPGNSAFHLLWKFFSFQLCALCLLAGTGKPSKSSDARQNLFDDLRVHQIQITIKDSDLSVLRSNPRKYVSASVTCDGVEYQNVGIHLKGSVGSFRSIDGKPALTLDLAKFDETQRVGAVRKVHLNNSVEDPSYANEFIGSELFRSVGIPAPMVNYALVQLNGRDVGLYVLKEGFSEEFLARYFNRIDGNLYDTETGHDLDQVMKNHANPGQATGERELRRAAKAAGESDPDVRWNALNAAVDMDRFLKFMAMEIMLCHRDGYSMAKNNFWIYHDPESNKLVFLPSGMDQLFGRVDQQWNPYMAGIVSHAVMSTPQGEKAFKDTLSQLVEKLGSPILSARIDEALNALKDSLTSRDFKPIETEAALLKKKIAQRAASLREQLRQADEGPLQFANGVARLENWKPVDSPFGGRMTVDRFRDGKASLYIKAGPDTFASWRTAARLERGKYQFRGKVAAIDVKPLPFAKVSGPGIRVSGVSRTSQVDCMSNGWNEIEFPFEVQSERQDVEFIAELRASAGEAWFDLAAMEVMRIAN